MKNLLAKYAAYNAWANHKIIHLMKQLDPELWNQQTPSSFDSLLKTVIHISYAETVWWQRLNHQHQIAPPSNNMKLEFKVVCNTWLDQSMQWVTFFKTAELNDGDLVRKFVYKNLKGDEFIQPVSEILMHVFNHSTYHRGQLVTMLRALGIENIPPTDFIVWSRSLPL